MVQNLSLEIIEGPAVYLSVYFCSKIIALSKKKKGLHLELVSEIPIFVPKSWRSLKKKGLHLIKMTDAAHTYFITKYILCGPIHFAKRPTGFRPLL